MEYTDAKHYINQCMTLIAQRDGNGLDLSQLFKLRDSFISFDNVTSQILRMKPETTTECTQWHPRIATFHSFLYFFSSISQTVGASGLYKG